MLRIMDPRAPVRGPFPAGTMAARKYVFLVLLNRQILQSSGEHYFGSFRGDHLVHSTQARGALAFHTNFPPHIYDTNRRNLMLGKLPAAIARSIRYRSAGGRNSVGMHFNLKMMSSNPSNDVANPSASVSSTALSQPILMDLSGLRKETSRQVVCRQQMTNCPHGRNLHNLVPHLTIAYPGPSAVQETGKS